MDAHPQHHARIEPAERHEEGRRITWVSVVVNVLLTAMQVVVGIVAHSASLIADAMHTLSDIVADVFVLWANRRSAEAADEEHPYGHGRYETVASLVLGVLLMVTGTGILLAAAGRIQNLANLPQVGQAAMWAAIATLVGKEGLFRYMLGVAERLRSPMLVANAWHARADALSSLVVAVGIGGALAGFNVADAVAAIVVGAMIVKAGAGFAWDAVRELIDTGLAAEEVADMRATLAGTCGVVGIHELRTRRMAHQVLVDAHIQVSPRVSVSEGHRIGEIARQRLLQAHPEVLDVLVHIDAEEDLDARGTRLPERAELIAHLAQLLGVEAATLSGVTLHYLGDKVEAEVRIADAALREGNGLTALRARLAERLPGDPWFATVELYFRVEA